MRKAAAKSIPQVVKYLYRVSFASAGAFGAGERFFPQLEVTTAFQFLFVSRVQLIEEVQSGHGFHSVNTYGNIRQRAVSFAGRIIYHKTDGFGRGAVGIEQHLEIFIRHRNFIFADSNIGS